MGEWETVRPYLRGYAEMLTGVSATGRRPTREELDERRALGERAAEDGHSLRALVRHHLAATRAAWHTAPDSADRVLAAVEQAVDAFAEGYERAQRMAVREEEAARRSSSTTCSTDAATWAAWPNARNASASSCPGRTRSRSRRDPRRTTTPHR